MNLLRSTSPIGLDIGARTVAAAQLSRRRGVWQLETASVIPRPAGADPDRMAREESERLADILGRQGFARNEVVLAVPDRKLMASVLDLPPRSSGAPIADLARAEMARAHRREPGSFEMASWELPSPLRAPDATHLMAAACAHAEASALMDPIELGGLSVVALALRAWAMFRACERPLAGATDVAALLDLGESGAVVALVRSATIIYERSLPDAGLAPLRARFAATIGADPEIADPVFAELLSPRPTDDEQPADVAALLEEQAQLLVRELHTALSYAIHRYGGEVSRVLLHGPGARLRGLPERLTRDLGAPAAVARPLDLVDCAPGISTAAEDPALSVAVGLARHAPGRAAA
jgi:type IV pilus assembly protein PilM